MLYLSVLAWFLQLEVFSWPQTTLQGVPSAFLFVYVQHQHSRALIPSKIRRRLPRLKPTHLFTQSQAISSLLPLLTTHTRWTFINHNDNNSNNNVCLKHFYFKWMWRKMWLTDRLFQRWPLNYKLLYTHTQTDYYVCPFNTPQLFSSSLVSAILFCILVFPVHSLKRSK